MCCFVWSDGDGRGAGTFDASAVGSFSVPNSSAAFVRSASRTRW